jgi:hypothetical protein
MVMIFKCLFEFCHTGGCPKMGPGQWGQIYRWSVPRRGGPSRSKGPHMQVHTKKDIITPILPSYVHTYIHMYIRT